VSWFVQSACSCLALWFEKDQVYFTNENLKEKTKQNKKRKEKFVSLESFFLLFAFDLISSRSSVELISRVCLPVETETQDQSNNSEKKKKIAIDCPHPLLSVCVPVADVSARACRRRRHIRIVIENEWQHKNKNTKKDCKKKTKF